MFKTLHRLMKAAIVLGWTAAALALWTQRERGRPLVDWYQAWQEAGYQNPEPLPRLHGDILRVVAEDRVFLKDTNGLGYELIVAGLPTTLGRSPEQLRLMAQHRTNLAERVVGRPAEFAYTLMQPSRVGIGFLYLDSTNISLNVEMVCAGKAQLPERAIHLLPLREQVALRIAMRTNRPSASLFSALQ